MEAERSALAKELHDELGGLITAAKMDMAWLQAHIGASLDPASDEKFHSVVQMLNQAMTLKRRVVESLRPSLLDHFGLPVALRSHFDENCGRAGLEYVTTLPDETLDLEPAAQLTLFRVAQEALASRAGARVTRNTSSWSSSQRERCEGYSDDRGRRRRRDGCRPAARAGRACATAWTSRAEPSKRKSRAGQGNRIRVYVPRSPAKSG